MVAETKHTFHLMCDAIRFPSYLSPFGIQVILID